MWEKFPYFPLLFLSKGERFLGTKRNTKTDEISEKFRRGDGGSFSIQKFILQIFAIINSTSVMNSGKKCQYNFLKMRGQGIKGRLKHFRILIRFGHTSYLSFC